MVLFHMLYDSFAVVDRCNTKLQRLAKPEYNNTKSNVDSDLNIFYHANRFDGAKMVLDLFTCSLSSDERFLLLLRLLKTPSNGPWFHGGFVTRIWKISSH